MLGVMLLLSAMVGAEITAAGASGTTTLGRLRDVSVSFDSDGAPDTVARMIVRRRGGVDFAVPWSRVDLVTRRRIELHTDTAGSDLHIGTDGPIEFSANEIRLVRDVLDTQIVDVVGRRLSRVGDVVLDHRPDGRLEPVGVDVGFGAVLRRLGAAALGVRLGEDAVAWSELHLTSDRGHVVQLNTPRSAVHHLDVRGLAALVVRLDTGAAADVVAGVHPAVAAQLVRGVDPAVGERILRALPDSAPVMAAMPAEHAGRWQQRLGSPPRRRSARRSTVWPRRGHQWQGERL